MSPIRATFRSHPMSASRTRLLAFCACLAVVACSEQESAPAASAASPAAAATTPTEAAAPAVVASGDSIGIAACDDYLTKYEACIADKVPAETRAALKISLDQTREAWRSAIAAGTSTSDLESACKTMHESARQGMSAYGCSDF
jgi:hypothetical protein